MGLLQMPLRERLFWASIAIYVAVLPMSSTIALRNVAFIGILATTLWALARREVRLRFPVVAAWAPYAAVALLSVTWAVDRDYSINQVRSEILYGAIIFVIAASRVDNAAKLLRLAWIAAVCNAFMVGYSFYLIAITPQPATALIGSFRAATGTYSTYLVTVAPLLMFLAWSARRAGRERLFALLCALIAANLVALFFTANRQGFVTYALEVGIVGALALRARFTLRRLAAFAAVVLAIGALFGAQQYKRYYMAGPDVPEAERAVNSFAGDLRWGLWRYAADQIAERPWRGAGFGRQAFQKTHPEFPGAEAMLWHAHNMVLNKGVQMGLPGIFTFLLLWCALAWSIARAAWRGADAALVACATALLAGVFLKNMTDDFFVQDNALLFWLFCGAFIAALRLTERQGTDGAAPAIAHGH